MSEQIWWYATRAAGLMTWATAMASIVLGLVLSFSATAQRTRQTTQWLPSKPWLLDLHRFVGGLSLVFLAIHMVTLWADSFVHFGWAELFLPGASEWRPLPVAGGVMAAWLLAGVEASSLLKKHLPPKIWHRLHLGSYLVAVSGTVHAFTAGSDVDNPIILGLGSLLALLVVGLTVLRVVTIRLTDGETNRAEQLERARVVRDNPAPKTLSLSERFANSRAIPDPVPDAGPQRSSSGRESVGAGTSGVRGR